MKDRFVIQVEGVKRDFFKSIFHTWSNLMSSSLLVFVIEFDHAINLVPRSMSESISTYLVPKAKTLCFEFSRNKQYHLRGSRAFN